MSKKIIASFKEKKNAQTAIEELKKLGYGDSDFSVLYMEEDSINKLNKKESLKAKAPNSSMEGAVIGASVGAGITGLTSFTAIGISSGVSLLASGPLALALLSAGVAASAGGIVGGLVGVGLSEHEAKAIDKQLIDGKLILDLSVQDKMLPKVKKIMEKSKHYLVFE
jgi:hypothetical protein